MLSSRLLIQKSLFDKPMMVFSGLGVLFTLLFVDKSDWSTDLGLHNLQWTMTLILMGTFVSLVFLAFLVSPLMSEFSDEEQMLVWLPYLAELFFMLMLASSMLLEVSPYILVSLAVIQVIHYARLVVSFMVILWSLADSSEGVE